MIRPTNWTSLRGRDAMRRHGFESKRGGKPYDLFLPPPRPRPNKRELRAEAEQLVLQYEKDKAAAAFRERVHSTAERLKTSLIYNKSDAVGALWRYARDNGVIEQIGADAVTAIIAEAGL
jgi:hypothetical protein